MAVASKYNKYRVPPPAARVTLRGFALAVHDKPGVADACVSLQDRFDADVNILLCAAYLGAVRGRSVSSDEVAAARGRIDAWHRDVVRPLRAARRLLKTGPPPAPNPQTDEVRREVAKAELDAELVELDVLGDWAAGFGDSSSAGTRSELARTAMEVALRSYSNAVLSEDDRNALAVIADTAARCDEVAS
ncbi:TIGR02444 family protein [Mycolicibacterium gadium]|uniref:TIGR02444 family protein n=1 Tax=Mycolicibacterium gadium TaxID=1794 RepID=UPI0013D464D0|nr:TIGR02444 family protein [Mycolicibacterium gadium]